MFSRSTHDQSITLGLDYEVQSSDEPQEVPMPRDTYSKTLNRLHDPDGWDVRGIVKDIRTRLWDSGDLEAAALIDYLTDRVNEQERNSVVNPADAAGRTS